MIELSVQVEIFSRIEQSVVVLVLARVKPPVSVLVLAPIKLTVVVLIFSAKLHLGTAAGFCQVEVTGGVAGGVEVDQPIGIDNGEGEQRDGLATVTERLDGEVQVQPDDLLDTVAVGIGIKLIPGLED